MEKKTSCLLSLFLMSRSSVGSFLGFKLLLPWGLGLPLGLELPPPLGFDTILQTLCFVPVPTVLDRFSGDHKLNSKSLKKKISHSKQALKLHN